MHGWGGSIDSFTGVARNIQNHRITLLDFYGFGDSEHPENPLCLDDYVEAVKEIIEFYDMKNLTVCAHSFGGRVAIKLASQNFPYIKRMLLTDSAGVLPKRGLSYKIKVGAYKFFKKFNITLKTGSQDYNALSDVMKKTFVNVVNEDLTPLLSEIKAAASVPLLMRKSDYRVLEKTALDCFLKDALANDLYNLVSRGKQNEYFTLIVSDETFRTQKAEQRHTCSAFFCRMTG